MLLNRSRGPVHWSNAEEEDEPPVTANLPEPVERENPRDRELYVGTGGR